MKDLGNENPLVSIITPCFNAQNFIEETIKSVRAQTYTNWEMIICDDVSSDDSRNIIEKHIKEDSRIKLIKLDKNSGAAVARNTAIKAAKGKYIAFLDSDDLWIPQKLEKQVAFMLENDIVFSFTEYSLISENGKDLGKIIKIPDYIDYRGLLKNTIIGCLTVMLDIEKLGKVQMPLIRTRQDFALWLSILRDGHKAYGIHEALSKYRLVQDSISRNKWKAAKRNWQVYREIEKLPFFDALWCFINYAWNAYRKNKV